MQLDSKALFDQQRIRAAARPGQLYLNNTAPVFLVICSSEGELSQDGRTVNQIGYDLPERS